MKKYLYFLFTALLLTSCGSVKFSDFSKRKYLNLKNNPPEEIVDVDETEDEGISENIITEPQSFLGEQPFEETEQNTIAEDLTAEFSDEPSIEELNLNEENRFIRSEPPVDDSLTYSGEDPTKFAIRDQMKIMKPAFKWTKVLFIISLIMAAAIITLFFTIAIATPLGELLYVLLIFKGLFTVVGIASGIRAKVAAKKLLGLTEDKEQIKQANKVSKVVPWLVAFMIAIPVLGLIGLVIYHNV